MNGAAGLPGRMRLHRDDGAIAVLLAALAFILAAGSWSWRADRVLYDLGLTFWSRPAPDEILIVAIDDASIDAIGRWPWPRAVHATLLQRMAEAAPRVVLLDLVLSEADPDPAQDRLLAEALRRAAPVLLPVHWLGLAGGGLRALEPVEPLRSAAGLGAAEAAVDDDGVLRSAFLQSGPGGGAYPHLALALLRAGGGQVHPDLQVENGPAATTPAGSGQRQGRFLIRYTGGPGHVRRVSYVDLLRGAVPAASLKARDVLIGMTAQGLGDTLATPVNAGRVAMPGVEVLANTLHTLRSGDSIHAMSPMSSGLLSAALVLLLVSSFGMVGARVALGLAVASIPLAVLASLVAIDLGGWWSPVPYGVSAALAYPLWSWRRLERAVHELDREIGQLDVEANTSAGSPAIPAPRPLRDPLGDRVRTLAAASDTVRQARRFLAEAVAGLPTAMLVVDERARVLLANPLAAGLFELEAPEQLQGMDLPGLLEEFVTVQPVDWAVVFSAAAPSTSWAVEARLERLGDYVIHVARVDLSGWPRWIVTLADVAPLKQAQRRREEMLAFVSHDLRSPASAIVMLADLHWQGRLDMPRDELLTEIRRLAAGTLQLSEDFVRTAQAESRPLNLASHSLREVVNEVLADFGPQALTGAVTLIFTAPDPVPWNVDRALVARAVGNLLSNAIKHSPEGAAVDLELAAGSGAAVVSVRDRGPGLTPAQHLQLAQGDRGVMAVDADGVGFGLLFVQRVARRHGGELRARAAEPGPGTVFELRLGRAASASEL